MSEYYRVCKSLNEKGTLVKEGTDFDKYKKGEAYVSVYKYTDEHKKRFDETGTIAGITDVKGDILYMDFDGEHDIGQAQQDTVEAFSRLSEYFPEDTIMPSLSGGKGFHIAVHLKEDITPKQAKLLATNVCGDLSTFDDSIYNASRIIRLEGSKHQKTSLRKTRLDISEIKSETMDDLKELAKEKYEYIKPKKATVSNKVKSLMKPKEKELPKVVVDESSYKVDYLSNPLNLSPWKLALSQGIIPSGQRNNALTILAASYKAAGMTETQAYHGCKAAAEEQGKLFNVDKFSKEEIYKSITQVFSSHWNGGAYSEENFPIQLQKFFQDKGIPRKEHQNVVGSVTSLNDVFGDFTNYLENIDKNILKTGIKSLDETVSLRIGTVNVLAAPPSVGKTSASIEILNNLAINGHRSFMASYDMYRYSLMTRLAVKHCGYTEDTLFKVFKDKDTVKIQEIKETLNKEYGNVDFCFKTGQTISELRKTLELSEKVNGKLSFVVVDYLELVASDRGTSDPTQKSAEAIQGLRDIANAMSVCILVLAQPNKMNSKLNVPMTSFNGIKGSGDINAASSVVITMHREGLSPDSPKEDKYVSFTVQKNRFGPLGSVDLGWEGSTQRIYELDDNQRMYLKMLRDLKSELKDDDGI